MQLVRSKTSILKPRPECIHAPEYYAVWLPCGPNSGSLRMNGILSTELFPMEGSQRKLDTLFSMTHPSTGYVFIADIFSLLPGGVFLLICFPEWKLEAKIVVCVHMRATQGNGHYLMQAKKKGKSGLLESYKSSSRNFNSQRWKSLPNIPPPSFLGYVKCQMNN